MTQDKELLLKDLSARLLYGIKFPMMCWDEETGETVKPVTLYSINKDGYCHVSEDNYSPHIDEIKPYLFPLSSMTDEQKDEYHNTCNVGLNRWGEEVYYDSDESIDWLNAHHFDYRRLIEKSLALDATNLGIYE